MRKIVATIIVITAFLTGFSMLTGCEKVQKKVKHIQSDYIGLRREIVLYDYNGQPIKTYKGKFKVEIEGSIISWIDDNGKEIKLIGGIKTIEEQ